MKVFNNIISKKEQEDIKTLLFGRGFPWYYVNDISHTNNEFQTRPGHSHVFYDKGVSNSTASNMLNVISDKVNKKIKKKVEDISGKKFFTITFK